MYCPAVFLETRLEILHDTLAAHPLGTRVSCGQSGLSANLVPFNLDRGAGPNGRLTAHISRANDQLADLSSGREVLVMFQGAQAYVSPSFYPSKAADGKVVPTWNYIAVEVKGTVRVVDDPDWLLAQVTDLTEFQESALDAPWAVADAPADYLAA